MNRIDTDLDNQTLKTLGQERTALAEELSLCIEDSLTISQKMVDNQINRPFLPALKTIISDFFKSPENREIISQEEFQAQEANHERLEQEQKTLEEKQALIEQRISEIDNLLTEVD